MNNFTEQLKKEAHTIRLTQGEKDFMRARIFSAPKPSPYFVFSFQFTSVARYALTTLVLVVFVSGGTVSAAYGALPGDLLYPIKISVNENVEQVLAMDSAAKASVHTKLAQRRLEEAEALAAKSALSAEVVAQLEENFDTHVKSADTLALELEDEEPGTAAEVSVTLASSLATHADILAALGQESEDSDTREYSSRFSQRLLARAEGDSGRSMRLYTAETVDTQEGSALALSVEDDSAPSADAAVALKTAAPAPSSETQMRTALYLAQKASTTLARTKETFEKNKSDLEENTIARADAQFEKLDGLMKQGSEALIVANASLAIEAYTQVLRSAVALEAYLGAEERFERNFLPSFLRGDNTDDGDSRAEERRGEHDGEGEDGESHRESGDGNKDGKDEPVRILPLPELTP